MPNQRMLSLIEFASESGVSTDTLRNHLKSGKFPDAKKINNQWRIPEKYLKDSPKSAPKRTKKSGKLMDLDESEQIKKHYDAIKAIEEHRKLKLANDKTAGALVDRSEYDAEYSDVITTLRGKILDIPNRLKQKCNEELTEHVEAMCLLVCEDLLNEMACYTPAV